MKKVLSLVLALAMVLGSFSFVSAAPVSDVAGTVYEEAVTRLELLKVLEGYPDGTFKPEATITRAEFAAVAVRVKGLQAAADASRGLATGFTDVAAGNWAAGYVGTAGKLGIVNGVGNGLFAPNAPVKYEEAVTMIVRALGYEAAAQTKGGYPYGYLIVANEIGLLDKVKGTQGAPAPRGIVAQIADNALEIPLMIQVGFGSDVKWVVSGSNEHGTNASEQYLLDSLGFDSVLGRVTFVSKSKSSLTVTVEEKAERDRLGLTSSNDKVTIDIPKGFDTYEVEYLETKFWYNDDLVIARVQEEAKFDAVKPNAAGDEFTLVTEDEAYDVASGSDLKVLELNDENYKSKPEDFKANYAKIVLNDDDEVVWAKGYKFDDFIVVESIEKDTIVYSYDKYADVDLDDYTVVKDGKTIGIEGLVEGDVVFYAVDEEFAVVYNNVITGTITRTYADSFKLDGEDYDLADANALVGYKAAYLDDGKMDDLDEEALEAFEDAEAEVEVFVDYYGDAVLVVGGRGVSKTKTFGGYLEENATAYSNRNRSYLPLDMVNENDEDVVFDADKDVLKDSGYEFTGPATAPTGINILNGGAAVSASRLAKGNVIEYTVDEKGNIEEFELPTKTPVGPGASVKTSAKYANGFRLQNSTVVFLIKANSTDVKKVFTWENAKEHFGEMTDYDVYSDSKNNATYLVVRDSDAGDYDAEIGMVIEVNKRSGRSEWETVINIAGTKYTFDLENDYSSLVKKVVSFNISDDMKEIDNDTLTGINGDHTGLFKLTSLRNETFQVEDVANATYNNYELVNDAVVFDVTGSIKTRDLSYIKDGYTVDVYTDLNAAGRFVKYLVIKSYNGL